MQKMTSLERCLTVIRHGIPDRVPVDLHNFLSTIYFAGFPMGRALQDGEMMAEAQLVFWKEVQHDMLLVENGVVAEAQACGCGVEYPEIGPARVAKHILADGLEKIVELEVPDPFTTFPMCEVLKAVKILRQELGEQVFIMGRADQGPVALALALRGYERFILDLALMEQPELIHQVLAYCVKVQTRYALALKEAGAHGTSTGGAGVDIIGPRLYRTIEHPYECQFISAVNRPDFPVFLHICGDSTLILNEMISTGAPILELDYKTDMRIAKDTLRGRATFLGPVNPELIWNSNNPQEVEEAARQAIEILAPGGEFILGPGCTMGYDTSMENIKALVQAAWKYGVYRSDGNLL
jgi:uroporphyrinogen decarboxylase